MVVRAFGLCFAVCCGVWASSILAAPLTELPTASVMQYGGYITDLFVTNFKVRQVNFDADLEKGVGFFDGVSGIIAVPVKGLSSEQLDKQARTPIGAGLCYLYLGGPYRLTIDGKPVPEAKLRIVKGLGNNGEPAQAACFICTVRQPAAGGRELCVFGADKQPLLTTKFENVNGGAPRDFALTLEPDKDGKLSVVIGLFGNTATKLAVRSIATPAPADDDSPDLSVAGGKEKSAARKRAKTAAKHPTQAGVSLLQFDMERSGYVADSKSLPQHPRIVWTYPAEGKGSVAAPGDPLVDNGVLYFGDQAGQLHALISADGAEKWVHDYGPHAIVAAPAVAEQKIYVASAGSIKCVSSQTGEPVWSHDLPKSFGESSPLLVGDAVFVGCGDGFVRGFQRKTGEPIWQADLISDRPSDLQGFQSQLVRSGDIAARMRSAASDGTTLFQPIYDQYRVVALDCRTGQRRWTYATRGWIPSEPTVAGDYVLFGAHDMYLHCVNRLTGKPVWKFPGGDEVQAAPAVANGRVYFTSWNARLHCADLETGKPIWMHRMDAEVEGTRFFCAPIVTDDTVYIGATNGFVTAIDTANGSTRWSISLANNTEISSFALTTDGKRIFATSRPTLNVQARSGIFAIGD